MMISTSSMTKSFPFLKTPTARRIDQTTPRVLLLAQDPKAMCLGLEVRPFKSLKLLMKRSKCRYKSTPRCFLAFNAALPVRKATKRTCSRLIFCTTEKLLNGAWMTKTCTKALNGFRVSLRARIASTKNVASKAAKPQAACQKIN